jgi:hypothetical protein
MSCSEAAQIGRRPRGWLRLRTEGGGGPGTEGGAGPTEAVVSPPASNSRTSYVPQFIPASPVY